ncbi:helix-turn-helix domain-containing protein [Nocardiopsis sp. Huas11]|uniref:helix-turn-helix domain-containing protein n=1 Tax=Nocardiopsis sp. Huas11 TaxID=2183912 RepID=UPI0013159DA3
MSRGEEDPARRAFAYRLHPTEARAVGSSRAFGCVRLVHGKALVAPVEAWCQRRERIGHNATSAMLTSRPRTDDLAFPAEASNPPPRRSSGDRERGSRRV